MATILVIDDQPGNRDVLVTLLGYHDHRLLEASDGLEGLAITRAERPDLIITDIRMPRMDGFEFVRHLREEPTLAAIPVIFYSATYRLHEVKLLAHACGVVHLIPKPSEPQAILDIVNAALKVALPPLIPLPQEEFDRQHLQLLTAILTRHIVSLEETGRRLRTMMDFGQALAAEHETWKLFERICHLGRELVGAQYAILGIVDTDGQSLSQVMSTDLAVLPVPSSIPFTPQSPLGDLLVHGCARRVHALPGDDPQVVGLLPQYPPVHSFLGAPLMTSAQIYGCLCLLNTDNLEGFTTEDEHITRVFTMQAALAYENARRYDALEHYATQLEQEVARRELAEEELRHITLALEQRVAERTAALQGANAQLTGRSQQLEQRHQEVTVLSELGSLLHSCLTAEEAYAITAQCCQRLFPEEAGALYVFGASQHLVEAVTVWGTPPVPETAFTPEECWALRRGRLYIVAGRHANPQCLHARTAGAWPERSLCLPLVAQGQALGVLHLRCNAVRSASAVSTPETWTETTQRLAEAVVEHTALALANVHLRQTLHIQSTRDPLTGLFNRRYMEESLAREIHRAVRHEQPIGVLMLDVDHFKRVNDVYGHDAGDTLLQALGHLLRTNSRAEDIACRYGGEEFLLILPNAPLAVMQQRAEHLRVTCKHLRVQHRGQTLAPVTLSLGIAVFPEHGATCEALVRVADTALYRAKATGRDRIVVGSSAEEGTWPLS
ncbi:MAG: diguanylate cyclase [Candidatus Tectimicrobiota bacterium]